MNPLCEGCVPGEICTRHKMIKNSRQVQLCLLNADTMDGGLRYWKAWEEGRIGATAPESPYMNPLSYKGKSRRKLHPKKPGFSPTASKGNGPGTELKKVLAKIGIHATSNCSCNRRAFEMDRNGPEWCRQNIEFIVDWMSDEASKRKLPFFRVAGKRLALFAINKYEKNKVKEIKEVLRTQQISFAEPVRRNLLYHIYPMKRSRDLWQWNLDQIIRRIDLFNGKRIVGIVTDGKSDPAGMVKEYLKGYDIIFEEHSNIKKRGEGVTFGPMMQRIESYEPNEVTFRAHAKCVSKKKHEVPHIKKWTEMMYGSCLDDWQLVKDQLEKYLITGPFRRTASMGGASWFYSGSFYWFRNMETFQRNWQSIHRQRVGIETWPHNIFRYEESGCVFGDNATSLYHKNYVDDVAWTGYQQWLKDLVPNRIIVESKNQHPKWMSNGKYARLKFEHLYKRVLNTPSDISDHITTLKELASRCETVTEFGTRYGVSTIALLAGKPLKMVSYDIERKDTVAWIEKAVRDTKYSFVLGDTLKIDPIQSTDLLFIDTEHNYKQLKAELARHGNKANKYIVFHDTTNDGKTKSTKSNGLRKAIEEFIKKYPEWKVKADFPNNNGLMVIGK